MNDKIDVNSMNKTFINYDENNDIYEWFNEWRYDEFLDDFIRDDDYKKYDNSYIKGKVEKTSLYHAIEIGNIEIINLLLMNDRIDVNLKNKYHYFINLFKSDNRYGIHFERTALNLAVINENIEIVKLLLVNESIDVNLSNYDVYYACDQCDDGTRLRKATPLHLAIEKDNVEVVKLLLINNKIDVNVKLAIGEMCTNSGDDYNELTSLYTAIKHKNTDIVNLLLLNKNLDLNSSSIFYYKDNDYTEYNYWDYCNRKLFHKAYEQPYIKRYEVRSEKKNSDLLKDFASTNSIYLSDQTKKLLE